MADPAEGICSTLVFPTTDGIGDDRPCLFCAGKEIFDEEKFQGSALQEDFAAVLPLLGILWQGDTIACENLPREAAASSSGPEPQRAQEQPGFKGAIKGVLQSVFEAPESGGNVQLAGRTGFVSPLGAGLASLLVGKRVGLANFTVDVVDTNDHLAGCGTTVDTPEDGFLVCMAAPQGTKPPMQLASDGGRADLG